MACTVKAFRGDSMAMDLVNHNAALKYFQAMDHEAVLLTHQ